MKRKPFVLVSLLLCLVTPVSQAQSSKPKNIEQANQQRELEKLSMLSELRALDEEGINLKPLARATLKAQIADGAWTLDLAWAKALLIKAYELTLPDDDERTQFREVKKGAPPVLLSATERARRTVRNQVMRVASRERVFADQLVRIEEEHLGGSAAQMSYTNLAESARRQNELDRAGEFLLHAIDIDPSQITAGFVLADIAKTDRTRADRLIVEYLNRLQLFPLSRTNGSIGRIFFIVHMLVFRSSRTSPPGPAVMRAYAGYVIQSLGALEGREPGSLAAYRAHLLRAWSPLKQYAPELTADFMVLEQRSRTANETLPLPATANDTDARDDNDQRVREVDENIQSDEIGINKAIRRGDFEKARKLIDKLSEDSQKAQFTEIVNAEEALSLLKKDDVFQAGQLAEKLKRATSIRKVYPALIGKCVSSKDEVCATSLMLRAIKQIKESDKTLEPVIADLPASVFPTNRDSDPLLDGMAKLTLAVLPVSTNVALIGLSETVAAANISQVDTGEGRMGFDVLIFKELASKDETRVRQEAESLKDPFRRLLSLTAIYQWKVADFEKQRPNVQVQRKDIRDD